MTSLTMDLTLLGKHYGEVHAKLETYVQENRIAIRLHSATEGPVTNATVNLPHAPIDSPLKTFIKDYSENDGLLEQLESKGWVKRTGRTVPSGFIEIPEVELIGDLRESVSSFLGIQGSSESEAVAQPHLQEAHDFLVGSREELKKQANIADEIGEEKVADILDELEAAAEAMQYFIDYGWEDHGPLDHEYSRAETVAILLQLVSQHITESTRTAVMADVLGLPPSIATLSTMNGVTLGLVGVAMQMLKPVIQEETINE